jgi:dUTP pyrophosphatase
MKNIPVKIKLMRDGVSVPKYATEGAAAFDLCASIDAPMIIPKGQRKLIPTGIAISLPAGYVAILCARSGLSTKKGITAANGIGVIDSDYRGEIFFSSINLSDEDYVITPGERVAQLMIMPVMCADFELCDDLDKTERGSGGFGSTGK